MSCKSFSQKIIGLAIEMGYTFTRQEIFEKVWAMPMKKLAPEIGVTDSGLAKACRKANIPLPPRGFWAKKEAGKKVNKPSLPLRAPGASDTVEVGYKYPRYGRDFPSDNQIYFEPFPPPPIFIEQMDNLRKRIEAMTGRSPYPSLKHNTHPKIRQVLEQDKIRKNKYEESPYSWNKPRLFSPVDKRRFRIINALFLALQKSGCKPSLNISKYDDNICDVYVLVGNSNVSIHLNKISNKSKVKQANERLSLSISIYHYTERRLNWEDTKELPLEKSLTNIVNEIIIFGEIQYRNHIQWRHDHICERKTELEKEIRQRKIEEEKLAFELIEKQKREQLEALLSQASNLQKANTIRAYVANIREKSDVMDAPNEVIEQWAIWALTQAEAIDPSKSLSFLHDFQINNLADPQK